MGDDCPYDDPNPAGLIANINKLTGILGLDWAKQEFLHNMDAIQGKTVTMDLLAYLDNNGVIQQNIDFGNWAVDYLISNPSYNYEVFKNQFLGISEGRDGNFYAAYWENPNLAFPAQALPSWDAFETAYPKGKTGPEVFQYVGGPLYTWHLENVALRSNACALRVSRALNYSGVTIPAVTGTFKGADYKNYFLSAKALNIWMRKTFGTNDGDPTTPLNIKHLQYTSAQSGTNGQNLPGLLAGKRGIYSLVSSNMAWASGHADLLYSNTTCDNNCHFSDAPIQYIDIWILD